MLLPFEEPVFDDSDLAIFEALVRRDHWVRLAEQNIDFRKLRESIQDCYSRKKSRPAIEPVFFIKAELVQFHENLSDRQLFVRLETDLALRWFLGLGRNDNLPDFSTLAKFRAKVGADGHKQLFHGLIEQARGLGLVKDRLRLKDATHVVADIAIPAGIRLIAAARNKLLDAASPFEPERVAGERIRCETIRTTTDGQADDARLAARVEHLRDVLAWTDEIAAPPDADENRTWQALVQAREVARKALCGHDQPTEGDKLRSVSDPDARRGRHGDYYDGYMWDALVDADSELFTSINVLPANGNESADAIELIQQEESAHGNDVEMMSIDGAGFDGPTLRVLEDSDGLDIRTFVPDKSTHPSDRFGVEDFELSEDGRTMTCPAGHKSQYRQRDNNQSRTSYRFAKSTCDACPLRDRCLSKQSTKHGRTVSLSGYASEHAMVRERVLTEEYASVKSEHPRVERRLGDLMNNHGGRRARYRGLDRVKIQAYLTASASNLKRMLVLLTSTATGLLSAFACATPPHAYKTT